MTQDTPRPPTQDEIQALLHLGHAYLEHGQHTEAAAIFEGLTALPNTGAYPWMGLGVIQQDTDPERALQYFSHAATLEPGNVDARVVWAKLLLQRGQIDEARAALAPVASAIVEGSGQAWMLRQRLKL